MIEETVVAAWEAGRLSDVQALHALASDLAELESEIAALNQQRAAVREQIRVSVAQVGGNVVLPGYGRLLITTPAVVVQYDRAALDAVVTGISTTHPAIAEAIGACRTETARAGGLRIVPEAKRSG